MFYLMAANANEINAKVATDNLSAEAVVTEEVLSEQFLYAEQWELTRSGESVLSLPPIKKIIVGWLQNKQKKIQILYPGGEEGEFWVQELTDWLVALGIPSRYMVVVPGSGADDVIRLALIK
ncbi:MAG: hypothetical protein COB77_00165 [Gammaproteobacteria bacterium]|nr:MAG: hypothetical protein COB77_00165 [Gammaproteobacteria bacterium]